MHLTTLPQPFVVCVLTDRTPSTTLATMRLAQLDGADAFEVNLPALAAAGPDALRQLFAAVDRAVYTSCRRGAFMTVYGMPPETLPDWSEEERLARQLDAVKLGSVALDMELDAFDPHPAPPLGTTAAEHFARTAGPPAEVTHDPAAMARQQEVIAAAHGAGGEVILSCHPGRPLSRDQLVELAELAVERGADLVKIVSPCLQLTDLLALLEATACLKARLSTPFTLIGAGNLGTLSRSIGVSFGSAWAIGQQMLTSGGFHDQPLVAHLRETFRLLPWRLRPEVLCE